MTWLDAINWKGIGACPMKWNDEDYGALWSRRLWLDQIGGEIEFGFAPLSWANVNPIDPGTRQVISDGCRVLYDPDKILSQLFTSVDRKK
jgi:hypothetical protein